LEQDFNSLHAQREACEAYIRSQKHEGWQALPVAYDDGGISGATMDRPALQQLLVDIAAGRIDTVVVYKVDRLTRTLADFAKIVDLFDAREGAFVSVTQQFNTTNSMGRLTLNVLLSFRASPDSVPTIWIAPNRSFSWLGEISSHELSRPGYFQTIRRSPCGCQPTRRLAGPRRWRLGPSACSSATSPRSKSLIKK
jgi:hypothetical protein